MGRWSSYDRLRRHWRIAQFISVRAAGQVTIFWGSGVSFSPRLRRGVALRGTMSTGMETDPRAEPGARRGRSFVLAATAEGERAEPKGEKSAGHGGDDPEAAVVAVGGLGVEAEVGPQAE